MISIDILRYPSRYPGISLDILIKYPYNIPRYLFSYPNQLSVGYPEISLRYPSYFTFRVRPPCQSCWGGSDYVRPSRQHCWQQACPCLSLWDHFRLLRSDRCGCRIIAVRPTCHGCWEAAMGPRLGSPLHDPYDGLDAESRPPGTVFGGAAPLTKPVKIKLQSGERFHVIA
jgi:hypothetical protein